jgi:molecular chaperone GrpE
MDDNMPNGEEQDDTLILEDTGESVEEIEREMRETAEAAAETTERPGPGGDEGLRAENQQLKDRVLRTLADFENFRKRTEREKADYFRYATSSLLKDILPVLDNFDRALEHAEGGDEFHKGVLLIYKQLADALEKSGLKAIEQADVAFDPNIHEAVVREENDAVPSHTVVGVLQKGYFLHDRLLRPALVKVAVGGPERSVAS